MLPAADTIEARAMQARDRWSKTGHPLTPNTVKAVLQFTASNMPGVDTMTQGAGSLNALGAVRLAEAIDPGQPVGDYWLTEAIAPSDLIGGEVVSWAQRLVWGDLAGLTGGASTESVSIQY